MVNKYILFIVVLGGILMIKGSQVPSLDYLSPESIITDPQGKYVYVAMSTSDHVAVIDGQTGTIIRKIHTPEAPTGLALSPTEPLLYITGGVSKGKVCVINLETDRITSEIKVGHSPVAPVVSPDGKTLYVSNRFNNNVSVINLEKNVVIKKIPVKREPKASVITPDGKFLFIGNFLPVVPSNSDNAAASVSIINTQEGKELKTLLLPKGSNSINDLAVSPDGIYVYVTHILGRFELATTQIDRGWMNTNFLTVINTKSQEIVNSIMLDDLDMGAANSWGVTVSDDGTFLVVTHSGSHEISLIDRIALHDKLDRVARGEQVTVASVKPEDVKNDFSFLVELRHRIPLKGKGPRGVTIANGKIFVAEYFSGSLGIIDINNLIYVQSTSLGYEPEKNAVRRGEMIFNDAILCTQHWQSCASCHPDARTDGLNWDLMNDGIGNPKNTKSLLHSHQTPPVMGHGIRDNAEAAVRSGFKFILFLPIPENEAMAVDEYLKKIKPVTSPYLNNGKLTKSARRGKVLFNKIGCVNCHSGPYYTNLKSYDIGTLKRWDANMDKPLLDVPSLIEVWRTAPYLHDGRTMKVEEAFSSCHPEGVERLSKEEMFDLAEYVLSL